VPPQRLSGTLDGWVYQRYRKAFVENIVHAGAMTVAD
jgi:hypothetical protein